ncbi:MAG: alkaline phosphatase family protein [Planctomycetota bacterium]|jgi:predicted AlkP superfamily pyrophosphatase or phosphodiesterase|nr:alkaline phosphatase family protein [Planctomycetota bacterium]
MKATLVINVVGLTSELLNSGSMPKLKSFADSRQTKNINAAFPAVTCTSQANMLMGDTPAQHGAVANGWYFRDLSEVWLWRQSANLINGKGNSIFDRWRQSKSGDDAICHQIFWWWNLPSDADYSVTPRPTYFADGRKGPDIHSKPPSLRKQLQQKLGPFPLFNFWGPNANIKSTQWIIDATHEHLREHPCGLHLSYLPHLDYDLQRYGPNSPQAEKACRELDTAIAPLLDLDNTEVIVLSEYGIEEVHDCIYPNRMLNEAGLLTIHPAKNGALLDPGHSRAFAVCDHQLAHVYVKHDSDIQQVLDLFSGLPQIESVKLRHQISDLDHPRSGEIILTAAKGYWFAYHYWNDNQQEPDFARCVDIHKKPGYDPCELFLDPEIKFAKAKIAWKLIKKNIGMRYTLNVVPIDGKLVKGSHGRPPSKPELGPLIIAADDFMPDGDSVDSTAVFDKLC